MKIIFISFILTALSTVLSAQIVNIPDTNFKNYLLSTAAINSNSDTEIQVTEANAFSGVLNITNKNISNLTGIEAFINLTVLYCDSNLLTTLDMSNSPNLSELTCSYNQLSSLNVNNNISLIILNTNSNPLTTINLSNCTSLILLKLENNLLTTLDLSNNTSLTLVRGSQNPLTSLNISSNYTLQTLILENTQISSLDLSSLFNLGIVWLDSNNLSVLNVQNSNNTNMLFRALNNPNLTCIQVDNPSWSTTNWLDKDAIASYSTYCSVGVNEVNKANFNVVIYPNPANNYFNVKIIGEKVNEKMLLQIIDVTGKIVQQQYIFNKTNTIDASIIPLGYYNLTITNSLGVLVSKKIAITPQ